MIGKRIGRYQITEEIGRGGMGVVYKATQITLNRTVAVKMLPPHLALSREYLARFQREAETLARLAHENIVHIYDIEELDGAHFIIMEFVGGPSLSAILRREGRLDPARARDVAVRVADALAAAHDQGIIHRDIKPDNILFSVAGQPKLTDFGIAHMCDTNYKTQTGLFLGTPLYISPEQARGQSVTAASDLYSLGIVLYEMLCGRVPFSGGDPLAVALKHVQETPEPLQEVAPDVPAFLCAVVHRTLEKAPRSRYASARELQDALLALDLGRTPGMALRPEGLVGHPTPGEANLCPECHTPLQEEFLTCPKCGRAIRRVCTHCGSSYDPVSPECPFCRAPASTPRPTPAHAAHEAPAAAAHEAPAAAAEQVRAIHAAEAAARQAAHAPHRPREGVLRPAEHLADGMRLAREGAEVVAAGMARAAEHLPRVSPTLVGRILAPLRRGAGTPPASVLRRLLWIGPALILVAVLFLVLRPLLSRTEDPWLSSAEPTSREAARAAAGRESPLVAETPARPLTSEETESIAKLIGEGGAAAGDTTAERSQEEKTDSEDGDGNSEGTDGSPEETKPSPKAEEKKSEGEKKGGAETVPKLDDLLPAPRNEPQPVPQPPTEPGFDETAARREIRAIVDRQHRALQAGDLAGALADVSGEVRSAYEPMLRDVFREFRDIRIQILEFEVEFESEEQAQVMLRSRVSLTRRANGERLAEEAVEIWELVHTGTRWLITSIEP